MDNFDHLLKLPGPAQYQAWVKERLETLSVREGYGGSSHLRPAHCHSVPEYAEVLYQGHDGGLGERITGGCCECNDL